MHEASILLNASWIFVAICSMLLFVPAIAALDVSSTVAVMIKRFMSFLHCFCDISHLIDLLFATRGLLAGWSVYEGKSHI